MMCLVLFFFFFKQKTAYEMRISDWSSDVCSSDLMTSYCPLPGVGPKSPADNGYEGGFAVALMLKDLKLATQAAQAVDASVPMGNAAEALYQMLASAGEGGRDLSAIIETLQGKYDNTSTIERKSNSTNYTH